MHLVCSSCDPFIYGSVVVEYKVDAYRNWCIHSGRKQTHCRPHMLHMMHSASKSLSLDKEGTLCWGLSGSSSALRFTGSLARGVDQKTIQLEGTHMGGGEGERDVEEGEESEGQGEWKEGMGNTYSEADMCVCLQRRV